jgi:ubiquitin-conjugating enzyme E2 variant
MTLVDYSLAGIVIALEVIATWLLADFVSGVVHWAEDSYGRETTPVIGRWVVEPNLLHHRDPLAFVRRSWIASSWDLAAVGAMILAAAGLAGALTWHVVLFVLIGANANQIHKWNHMRRSSVPLGIRALQRLHLLQSARHHAQHHRGTKDSHYCVVTELLNPLLDRLGWWRMLERLLAPVLGLPRPQLGALHEEREAA